MNVFAFLDTETTGLCPKEGHRMVEIGVLKMKNGIILEDQKDGKFHYYINPERHIPEEVIKIHGITNEKVKNCPRFIDIAQSFLDFIKGSILVIHNAKFDLKFLNFQLNYHNFPEISNEVIDTLILAKSKFPGSPASLDALCKRFSVSLKDRSFHGALLDAKLLACVYRRMVMNEGSDSLFLSNENIEKNNLNIISKSENINQNIFYNNHFKEKKAQFKKHILQELFDMKFKKINISHEEHINHNEFMTKIIK
jgi:DNA polymerase-3 subunit epsilon